VTDRIRTGTARLTTSDARRLHHGHHELRGWDSNPRSRAHEAREDSRSSTAQVWPAGVEPAISGSQSRRGGLLPHSQTALRRQDSNLPLASNSRAPCRLDHAGTSFKQGAPAGVEPAPSRVRAGSSAV
jgi:hypothetical protein